MGKNKPLTKPRLAIILSRLGVFESPDEELEQYPTDSEIAGEVLWNAFMLGDIEGKRVSDLGCGGGVLGLGCLLLGAREALFLDRDKKALTLAKNNFSKLKSEKLLSVQSKARFIEGPVEDFSEAADVIIMNPPFGTRRRHHDRIFLEKAMESAHLIYSFHKSETLPYLRGFCQEKGHMITHEWNFRFPLKATMIHHRRKIHHIDVCCIRLKKQQGF